MVTARCVSVHLTETFHCESRDELTHCQLQFTPLRLRIRISSYIVGITAETHLLLEHAFCGHDVHGSAAPLHEETTLLLLALPCLTLLLLSCL